MGQRLAEAEVPGIDAISNPHRVPIVKLRNRNRNVDVGYIKERLPRHNLISRDRIDFKVPAPIPGGSGASCKDQLIHIS